MKKILKALLVLAFPAGPSPKSQTARSLFSCSARAVGGLIFRRLGLVFLALAMLSLGHTVRATPLYQTKLTLQTAIDDYFLNAFNDEGDILGVNNRTGLYFIYHLGVYEVLPLQNGLGINNSQLAGGPSSMNNADADGMVSIVGTAFVDLTNSDGEAITQRGACWLIPPDTDPDHITIEAMPNYTNTDGSEATAGEAYYVNDSGMAAGDYGFWAPPVGYIYTNAYFESYDMTPVTYVGGLDNYGNYLKLGWEWDLPTFHEDCLVGPTAGELPDVDSDYGTNAQPLIIHDAFVVGSYNDMDPQVGATQRGFVWQIGDARLTRLPDPDLSAYGIASVSYYSIATSVNINGDVVGWASFAPEANSDGSWSGTSFNLLWKADDSGDYTAYVLDILVEDEDLAAVESFEIGSPPLINDNDEIALHTFQGGAYAVTVLAPLATDNVTLQDGVTQFGSLPSAAGSSPTQLTLAASSSDQDTVTFDQSPYTATVTASAPPGASLTLQFPGNQNTTIPAVNAGNNTTVVLPPPGTLTANVALGGIVSQGAGNFTGNSTTAQIVSQGAGNIVSQGAGNIVSQGAGNIVSQGAGNIIGKPGWGIDSFGRKRGAGSSSPSPDGGSVPIQPTFTGVMTIDGNYSQFAGSTLIIGIAGTNTASQGAQQYDQLVVTGRANLWGGRIAFGLFDPTNQLDSTDVFQPADGATFDVVVATNIIVDRVALQGPIWGTGLFFSGRVVTNAAGMQVVRLTAYDRPPQLYIQKAGPLLQLTYDANYTGYSIQSTPDLNSTNWTTISTGTNVIVVNPASVAQFYRLANP